MHAHGGSMSTADLGPGSKSVRWASSVYSPASLATISNSHTRLTTREHYDFINHGIHPSDSEVSAGDGLTSLTPSMISAPWPEAHVEMLANMSAQRATENGESITGRNGVPLASPLLRQLQSHTRSTRDEDDVARSFARQGRTQTVSAGRRGSILMQSPSSLISTAMTTRVLLPPASPIRASLAFFSASPPKPGKVWTSTSQFNTASSGATPSLANAPFGRITSSLSEVMSAGASSPISHSRESTHQSKGSAGESTSDSIPGTLQSVSQNTSPIVEEVLQAKPTRGGKGKGKAKASDDEGSSTSRAHVSDSAPVEAKKPAQTRRASKAGQPAKAPPAQPDFGSAAEDLTLPAPGLVQSQEWDRRDGSRVVKLVSEELQQALEKGQIAEEPPLRYYILPPGFGGKLLIACRLGAPGDPDVTARKTLSPT